MLRILKNKIFFLSICLLLSLGISQIVFGQVAVINSNNATALAQKLVGSGVTISNASAACNANQAGLFTVSSSNLGIDSGIVLTTGNASSIGLINGVNGLASSFANANTGTSGDPDLSVLAGTNTFDRCILEFDLKADGDSIKFEYVFGSEEYPAFNCSNYNDVFGFFISGPGYTTPLNIALIPNTTIPVAINSVNDGTISTGGSISNCNAMGIGSPFTTYYISNSGGTSITYDGFTALFTAKASIQQCQTYHLKLAIADGFDHIFDSGVFLKAGSLVSNSMNLSVNSDSTNAGIPFLYEGCDSAIVKINRNLIQSVANTDTIQLLISGTATNGVDYPLISSSYIFQNNISDSFKTFVIKPGNDFVIEGMETIKLVLLDRCGTHVDSATIQVMDPPTFNITTNDTVICSGVTVNVQGIFNPDLSFTWQPPTNVVPSNQLNAAISPLITTTYTLIGNHPGCAPVKDSIKITVEPLPTISTMATNILCNGQNSGSITATGTAASGSATFTLYPGPQTQIGSPATFSNLNPNNYTVSVSSALGCTKTAIVNVSQPSSLTWNATTVLNISCNTNNVGEINVNAIGGTGTKTYTLMPTNTSNTTGVFTGLSGGTYIVTAKDANNCSIATNLSIIQISSLNWVTTNAQNISCNGQIDGKITAIASGGSGAITYQLNPGAITNSTGIYNNLSAGTYTVNASDATTCTASSVFVITAPGLLSSNLMGTNLLCNGSQLGAIQTNIVGGTPPFNFQLNPGAVTNTTGIFQSLSAGNYTVSTTDTNGCLTTSNITITQPSAITYTNITKVQPTCTQPNNGSIAVSVSGGVLPLSYSINGGAYQSSNAFTNLIAGTYTVIAKDANNCTKSYVTFLNVTNSPNLTNNTIPIVCGLTTTDLIVTASNGTPAYSYTLMPGAITNATGNFGPQTQGVYTVSVSDANGCTKSIIVNILPPLNLSYSIFTVTPIPCNATIGGSITAVAINGTNPYQYELQSGSILNSTGLYTNLSSGSYTVTATDANGCTISSIANINILPPMVFAPPTLTNPPCGNANSGSIALTTTGGFGTKTYTLNPGGTTNTTGLFANMSSGTYTVSVSDAYNCSNSTIVTLTAASAITFTNPIISFPTCATSSNGSISISALNGTGALTYKLNAGAFQNSGNFTGLNMSIYTIVAKDANNCTMSTIVSLINPNAMTFGSVNVTQSFCAGNANGNIQANVINGSGSVIYNLQPGNLVNASGNFTNLPPNTYTITASDAIGCSVTSTINIIQPNVMTWGTVASTNITCNLMNNGSMILSVSGGAGSVNYSLQPTGLNNPSGIFNNLSGANYTVTATDANGCTITTLLPIINPMPVLWSNLNSTNVICNGTPTASITAVASGGTSVLTYSLSPTSVMNNTGVFQNLLQNTYTVSVSDANGCSNSTTFNITQAPIFSLNSVTNTTPNCLSGNNAIITMTASGGNTPYLYQLNSNPPQSSNIFTNIGVSNYTVMVTDASGCSITSNVIITNPVAPNISNVVSQPILCFGNSNGNIQMTASGGTGALTFNLMPSNISNSTGIFSNLLANNYTVSATDANGCSATSNVILNQPPLLIWDSVNNRDISCYGGSNGLVTSSASGGTGNITYQLMPNNISNQSGAFLGLSVGVYTLSATDANGCSINAVFVINQAPPIVWNTTSTILPTCVGNSNGSLTAIATGGVGLFTYKLFPNNVQNSTGTFSGLVAGNYTVQAKDANSCTLTTAIIINNPTPIQLANAATTHASCSPGCDGTVAFSATGGNGNYTFSINGGSTFQGSNIFNNLCTGIYTVTIKDGFNCTGSGTFSITTANGPNSISSVITAPTCFNTSNGIINVTASGGTGIMSYTLNPNIINSSTGLFSNLVTGIYSIVASDANGCTISTVANMAQPLPISFSIPSITQVSCMNGSNGSISISASGGTGSLIYTLQPNGAQNSLGAFTSLTSGNYTIIATDVNNCSATETTSISQPSQVLISVDSMKAVSCFGLSDGFVDCSATGGTGTHTFSLQPGNLSNNLGTFNGLVFGAYTITAIDANGCTVTSIINISQPSQLNISQISTINPSCIPGGDGSITITANGGTPNYSFASNVNPTQASNTLSNIGVGNYLITVTDANLCTATSNVSVSNNISPIITTITNTQASCNPGCDGSLNVISTSGTGTHQYAINGSVFQTGSLFNNLCSNTYTVSVQDAVGCTATSITQISTVNGPTIGNVTSTNLPCYNPSSSGSGNVTVSVIGGSGVVNFNLMPGGISNTTGIFNNLVANTYTINGTDANGCTLATTISISQPTQMSFGNILQTPISCFNGNNGSLVLPVSGGTGNYSYSISPIGNFQSPQSFINLSGNTTYTIVVTDANNCSITTTSYFVNPPQLMMDTINIVPVTCFGMNNGSLATNAIGGTGLLTYTLLPIGTTNQTGIFDSLSGSNYTILVTDSNACNISSNVFLFEPSALTISNVQLNQISCFGANDGSISMNAQGGISPYNYSLQPGNINNTNGIFSNLSPSNYTIIATDFNGCTATNSQIIIEPSQLLFSNVSIQNAKCFNASDGFVNANATGGTGTITYTLLPNNISNTSGSFNNLNANSYTIIAKDINNCSKDTVITITQPSTLNLLLDSTQNATCFNANNGLIATHATGGTLPYLFTLTPGFNSLSGVYGNVTAGIYLMKVTDANGCLDTVNNIVITHPNPIIINSVVKEDVTCYSLVSGSIKVQASGGTGTLTYSISPALSNVQATPGNFTNLVGGSYTITVTDANNCATTTIVTLANYLLLVTTINLTEPTCYGDADGQIELSAIGGSMPLQFTLNNSIMNLQGIFTGLVSSNYTITVQDAKGCKMDTVLALSQPEKVGARIKLEDAKCNTLDDGIIEAIGSGGNGDYTYYLTPGLKINKTGNFYNLNTNQYTLTVKDKAGCLFDTVLVIRPPSNPLRVGIAKQDITCLGIGTEGWAKAVAVGGKAPYDYLWNTSQTDSLITQLTAGFYDVSVIDSNGCESKAQIEIEAGSCCEQIFGPTAFSPNGDGRNDVWRVTTTTGLKIIQYEIYNRWGNKVWTGQNIKDSWDGRKEGKPLGIDTYFYLLRYTCESDGLEYMKKGDITLIR